MLNGAKQILIVYSLVVVIFFALDNLKKFVESKGSSKKSLKLELRVCCLIPVIILLGNLF